LCCLHITGSQQRLDRITTIVTETERDIKIIQEELVELGDGLPELSSGWSALRCSNVLHLAFAAVLFFIEVS